MAAGTGPLSLLSRLRSTYWFVPSLVTAAALTLAFILVAVDRAYQPAGWLAWAYGGGPDGARSLLSSVAGSTITVVSVTFSVMVVALTVSSQHFGPRLLNSFMCDRGSQLALGAFTGTFAYCLVVLRSVRGAGASGGADFVPHLAVSAAVVLTLISVGMLIYYVHHVATSMQLTVIAANIAEDLERAIDRLYPERLGEGGDRPAQDVRTEPRGARTVASDASGYVQAIDHDRLLNLASTHDTIIRLKVRPGDFVVQGRPLASAFPPPSDHEAFAGSLNRACAIRRDRTSHQDAAFVIQQLVEIALHGLSPGVNEPFTAIACVDRLEQGLCRLAVRRMPSFVRVDGSGAARIVARGWTFAELLDSAFEPIIRYADRNAPVRLRLLGALERLAALAKRDEDRQVIRRLADVVVSSAAAEDVTQHAALSHAREVVRRTLEARADH